MCVRWFFLICQRKIISGGRISTKKMPPKREIEGRADPKVPRARYQEIANAIEDEKQGLRNFLMGDHEFGDLELDT